MSEPASILVVCTGNICRSPFIERLLQRRLDDARPGSPSAVIVRSAGTGALVGSGMDARAAGQLAELGGDSAGFVAQSLTRELVAGSDLVLTATRFHRGRVGTMDPRALRRVFTFCDFADLVAGIDLPALRVLASGDRHSWLHLVTERAAASRGLRPPLTPAAADIADPFGREDAAFRAMATQVAASMPAVVGALAG